MMMASVTPSTFPNGPIITVNQRPFNVNVFCNQPAVPDAARVRVVNTCCVTAEAVAQIEAAQFLPHSGIRFPQNPCTSCSFLGLCLDNQPLIEHRLIRWPGGELAWLDELEY